MAYAAQTNILDFCGGDGSYQQPNGPYTPRLLHVTKPEILDQYYPIPYKKFVKHSVFDGKISSPDKRAELYHDLKEKWRKDRKANTLDNTVVFFPCYSTGEGRLDDHGSFITQATHSLRTFDGKYPHVICMDHCEFQRQELKKIKKSAMNSEAGSSNMRFVYTSMVTSELELAAALFSEYINKDTKFTNIIISDVNVAKFIFKEIHFPSSFSEACFMKFKTRRNGIERKVMVTLTPQQFVKHEDNGYRLTAEIFNILLNEQKKPRIRKHVIKTLPQLISVLDALEARGQKDLAIDIETTGKNPNFPKQEIVSCSFSDGNDAWCFLVRPMKYDNDIMSTPLLPYLDNTALLQHLLSRKFDWIIQNAKFELVWFMKKVGSSLGDNMIYDTLLLDHWLNESFGSLSKKLSIGIMSMDMQIPRYLGFESHKSMLEDYFKVIPMTNRMSFPSGESCRNLKIEDSVDGKKGIRSYIKMLTSDTFYEPNSGQYAKLPLYTLMRYNNFDTAWTYRIFKEQWKRIEAETKGNIPEVITKVMPKQLRAIAEMELNGAPLDYDAILDMIRECDKQVYECKNVIDNFIDPTVCSIDSNDQIFKYLTAPIPQGLGFDKEEFFSIDEKKYMTDEDTLEQFTDSHPWIRDLILYKKMLKARNTYLLPFIFHSYQGNLYFNLILTGTSTGRLSSNEPNMQNIPKWLGDKKKGVIIPIKQAIRVPEGSNRLMFDLDFSTAEVKVLTAICPDEGLITAIKNKFDLHCYTASLMSGIPYEKVYHSYLLKEKKIPGEYGKENKEHMKLRSAAKSTTFGAIYRIGADGLAGQIKPAVNVPKLNERGEELTKREIKEETKALQKVEAQKFIDLLFTKVYPKLTDTFNNSDREVVFKLFGETLFGRRRRYHYTMVKAVRDILERNDYTRKVSLIKDMIPNQRPFRQNVNFEVQSPSNDYMQYFIDRLRSNLPKELNTKFHFTVHDSVVATYDNIDNADQIIRDVCTEAMDEYLPTLSKKMPVIIGYGIDFSKLYCENLE